MYEFDLGLKIKSYRLSINLTQAQFGERIGVSGAAVSFYETGTRTPSHRVLMRIANVMGVSIDSLLGKAAFDPVNLPTDSAVTLDITNLTAEQRRILRRMTEFFESYNQLQQASGLPAPQEEGDQDAETQE